MRGVKSDDLLAIVDFLHFGEANVCQENLDFFLAIAEELQLKGLMGRVISCSEITPMKKSPTSAKKKESLPSQAIFWGIYTSLTRGATQ